MAVNIEIKARVHDFAGLKRMAEQLSDTPCQVIRQEDTFFNCQTGRLKLRQLSSEFGQLVYYIRPDISGPKHSDYKLFTTSDPAGLKLILSEAYGVRGVISKVRYLYLVGQTRIHLDDVQGLGKFMELEVVLRPDQTDAEGQEIAEDLMYKLGIQECDLIETAYVDMLEKMIRAQCLVTRGNQVLMVKHRHRGLEWWCLPGGGVESRESAADAALRELEEECCVSGKILCQSSVYIDASGIEADTFWIEIGNQEPQMGSDPEFSLEDQILVDLRWLKLSELSERDRAYLWAAGLIIVPEFLDELTRWGDALSYPAK